MNPFSHAPNFVDMLSSQQDPQTYSTVNPTVQLGSSQVPMFSTQCTEDSSFGEDTPGERRERNKWNPPEDLLLISAWLNTSKDPVVCNEQKSGAFWKRVADYFASCAKVGGRVIREPSHCKNRWQKINDIVCKFCGCYEAATRERASGQNEDDVLNRAYKIFFNNHKKKFNLAHAWRELRFDQKWCELSTSKTDGSCKRRKVDDGAQSSSSLADEASKRPLGVKAAKSRGKKSVDEGKDISEFRTMWEIKEKDLAMKNTLANKSILKSLIAKKEPLFESEQALKEKLISDMLAN
ncbi:Glutathione S-transferase T3 [Cardamine amara subsp. amara]|uniref:Glutathione S-transferase T3 n=1 Tax=Cardamine amara subsp. amara TaxID=228776 RepID=A0ABD1BFJ6_CARAN